MPPSVAAISSQPTTGDRLVGTSSGRSDAGGALAPAPNPHLFTQSNPLAGVLPGSVFDPLVNLAIGADVPEFYVTHFDVPAFLLPIYQAAGAAYDIPWQVLAAINQVETNFGSDLNVSSAGAVGWMQFLPSTWNKYDVPASGTGAADPYNAADAIFSAAKYLNAAGATTDLPAAIYAYNHSDAYVQSVMLRAELLAGVPSTLVDSVSSLAEGNFPIELRYHPRYTSLETSHRSGHSGRSGNTNAPAPAAIAAAVESKTLGHAPRSTEIFAARHAAAVAVQAGTIVAIGHSKRLGNFVRLEDAFGNTYTYGNLASHAAYHLVAKPLSAAATGSLATLGELASGPVPTAPASAGEQGTPGSATVTAAQLAGTQSASTAASAPAANRGLDFAGRSGPDTLIFAPSAIETVARSTVKHAAHEASRQRRLVDRYFTTAFGLPRNRLEARSLRVGSHVLAGTILGYLGTNDPHLVFELRPAGASARAIDPRPFLDAWAQLATLELHRKALGQPLYGANLNASDAGEALLMSQIDLERLILNNTHLRLTLCERKAIAAGDVDRRVLASVEYLIDKGYEPTIAGCTSTTGGKSIATANSVAITGLNGVLLAGHTGAGTAADAAVRALASIPGVGAPSQIASFETVPGSANTLASASDAGEIVVSFTPQQSSLAIASTASVTAAFKLGATRWTELDAHLLAIPQPRIPTVISTLAVRAAGGSTHTH